MVKVSVIVPVYNSEKYLRRCLDSLIDQSIDSIEIIVVNDGSEDGSQDIINEYLEKNTTVKCLNKQNGGLSDARNYALPYTKGEYIGFVDSDDYVDKDMFEKMYNKAKEDDLDIVECDFIWEYPNKNKVDIGKSYINKEDYFLYGRVMACNKLFRASIIKENKTNFPTNLRYEDIEFFYKVIPFIKKTGLINTAFYHYIQREKSITNNHTIQNKDIFTILNDLIIYYKKINLYEEYKAYLEYLFIRILMGSSFLRILKINEKNIREDLLEKSFEELNNKFPNWKKNKLLKIKNKKNIYYRTINKYTYKIYSFIFKLFI